MIQFFILSLFVFCAFISTFFIWTYGQSSSYSFLEEIYEWFKNKTIDKKEKDQKCWIVFNKETKKYIKGSLSFSYNIAFNFAKEFCKKNNEENFIYIVPIKLEEFRNLKEDEFIY